METENNSPAKEPPKAEGVLKTEEVFYPDNKAAVEAPKSEEAPAVKTEEKKSEEEKPQNEPDKQEPKFELNLPADSLLDPAVIEDIVSYSKEKGLSPEVAQAILEREHSAVSSFRDAQLQHLEQQKIEWVKNAKADKEIGGDRYNESVELAHRVFKDYASPSFREELVKTGLGNHPELLRVFSKLGRDVYAEDKMIKPGIQAGGHRSSEDILYGKTK